MKIYAAPGGALLAMLSLTAGVGAAGAAHVAVAKENGFELGLNVKGEATPGDVGLPTYPGSKPYRDADDDSSAATIHLSAGLFGLKVVAMNLESSDAPQQIAAFYQRALSKYGDVIECGDRTATRSKADPDAANGDHRVACDAGDPGEHSVVYKVGTHDDQRIVAIKPHGDGARFSLVHVKTREDD